MGDEIVSYNLGSTPVTITAASAATLGAACSAMCNCKGFNSAGSLKSNVKPVVAAASTWIASTQGHHHEVSDVHWGLGFSCLRCVLCGRGMAGGVTHSIFLWMLSGFQGQLSAVIHRNIGLIAY